MVILESITRHPNGSMLFDAAKQESMCRMYRVEHRFLMEVVLTAVSLRIMTFKDDRLINALEKKLIKSEKTIKTIEDDTEFHAFAERLMTTEEFSKETMSTLQRQRTLFLRYLSNNAAKRRKMVDFEAAFMNWLNSEYRTEKPVASTERIQIPRHNG